MLNRSLCRAESLLKRFSYRPSSRLMDQVHQHQRHRGAATSTSGSTASPAFKFDSRHEYIEYLNKHHSRLPWGFAVGTTSFDFLPQEAPHLPSTMTMTLIKPLQPTANFGAVFTQNALPGAPVLIGKQRLKEDKLGAILINNKIANVCAGGGGGIMDAEEICSSLAHHLGLHKQAASASGGSSAQDQNLVFPSSTGVIGWRLPVEEMLANLPQLVNNLQQQSILPAALGIMTTDLYPKIRSSDVCGGRIVGIAKGAGMIEPNMATMLAYVLTDLQLPRDVLRQVLKEAVDESFNCLSVDTDQSTSDTVCMVSSDQIPFEFTNDNQLQEFKQALKQVCVGLSEDIVRNGEGADHVLRVRVRNASSKTMAKGVGKSIVNSPLLKCAIAGNDPNVGRLIMAIGKYMGTWFPNQLVTDKLRISMGGIVIFANGEFVLNPDIEKKLIQHMQKAQLHETTRGGLDATSRDYPPHGHFVEVDVDLGLGGEQATVLGIDLTHEYVAINADYRS